MMGITELAPAKLNLTLDVGARRPDGYHDLSPPSCRAPPCMTLWRWISPKQAVLR